MNATLTKSLVALLPAGLLFSGAALLYAKSKTSPALLQMLGAAGLTLVACTHVCEALRLFPAMQWGLEHSLGHYLDLSSAVLGLTLFPIGYLWAALRGARTGPSSHGSGSVVATKKVGTVPSR